MAKLFFEFTLFLLLVVSAKVACDSQDEFQKVATVEQTTLKPAITVELAIFCDAASTNMFQGNNQKLKNYWHQIIWNVDLRFRTLGDVDVSFRVNQIVTLKTWEEEQLMKGNIPSIDDQYSMDRAVYRFRRWVYEKSLKENLTNYDIAVLAMGYQFGTTLGKAYVGGACHVDIFNRWSNSFLILTTRYADVSHVLSHEIGHLLGAPHDFDEKQYQFYNCTEFNVTHGMYIMGRGKHLFSPCSRKSVLNFVKSDKANCLRNTSNNVIPVIDTSSHCAEDALEKGVSLTEQCQIMVNYRDAFVTLAEENTCAGVKCHINLGHGLYVGQTTFDPLDYSKCHTEGLNGICVRGKCVPEPGFYLLHLSSGKCLGNENPLLANSSVVLYECLSDNNFIEFIKLNSTGKTGYLVATQFQQDLKGHDTVRMCLSYNLESKQIYFEKCNANAYKTVWELRNISQQVNFILYHVNTRNCLGVKQNSQELYMSQDCSVEDTKQLWEITKKIGKTNDFWCQERKIVQKENEVNDSSIASQLQMAVSFISGIAILMTGVIA